MNILILNWRDIKNPKSGGAEILTHEIAKGLIKRGNKVTIFCSSFGNAKRKEMIDGVEVIRDGKPDLRSLFSSVHFKAYRLYKKRFEGKVDLVIDEVHGVPFFTPLYVKEKKIVLICEVAGSLWDIAVKFPFNLMGKKLEEVYPRLYKNVQVVTISDSSKKEIRKLFKKNKITIIHPGCSVPIIKNNKRKNKDLIFIARLSKSKGIEDAVKAMQIINQTIPESKLHIIGRGEEFYVLQLKEKIKKNGLFKNIIFHGFVSEDEKIKLLDRSAILICTSKKEGWGLTVHEANARGVPAVSYNVEGLRDVVIDGHNGFISKKNTPESISKIILTLLNDEKLYKRMSNNSLKEASKFTWKKTVGEFIEILNK